MKALNSSMELPLHQRADVYRFRVCFYHCGLGSAALASCSNAARITRPRPPLPAPPPRCARLAAPIKRQIVTIVVQLQALKKAILSDLPISTLRNAPLVHSGNVGLRHQAISGFRFPTHSSIDRFSVYPASAASTRSGRYRLLH